MKKSFLFIALVAIVSISVLLAQKSSPSIEKRWAKVNELAEKQLPESALKEVESILVQAQKEKNSVQVIKAMVYKMRFTLEKNPDEAPALIKDFEAFADKSTDPTERALLHSMTAELYLQYYQKDQWTINRRTEIKGLVPDDMKEWTKNIYVEKIFNHLRVSMENPEILQQTNAMKYAVLLVKGSDSRTMQPTLFDLLGCRKIKILQEIEDNAGTQLPVSVKIDSLKSPSIHNEVLNTYQQLIELKRRANNTAPLLNLDLEKLEYIRSKEASTTSDSIYLVALQLLEKQFSTSECVVEVLAEKADFYLDKYNANLSIDDEQYGLNENKKLNRLAYDICADGIKRFPDYKRIGILKNIQQEVKKKNLSINYKKTVRPATDLQVEIQSSNVTKLQLAVYRVNTSAIDYYEFKRGNGNKPHISDRTLIETRQISVVPDENFGSVTTKIKIKTAGYGIYEFSVTEIGGSEKTESANGSFTVTNLGFITRSNAPKLQSLYALDRQSGEIVENVNVQVYKLQWKGSGYKIELTNQGKTDNTGLCQLAFDTNYFQNVLVLKKGADVYFTSESEPSFREGREYVNENMQLSLFTDRSIYRPGQTVCFKGIAYYITKEKQRVAENTSLNVKLFDANNKEIASQSVRTNEFGSFTGQFILPDGGLNGAFRLSVNNCTQLIWVEEYKRPTFEVQLQKPVAEVQFGDKVQMKGVAKAFAGYNIGDAAVKYRVVRRTHYCCWWWSEPDSEVSNGTTKSNSDGSFEVSFMAEKTKTAKSRFTETAYSYTVYTDVTDTKGETQQGEQTVSVGDRSLFIQVEVPSTINKDKHPSLEISTETLNGEKVNSQVKYSILRLEDTDKYAENAFETTDLKVAEQVLTGSFDTKNKQLDLNFETLRSGRYKLVLTTKDAYGKEVKIEKTFVLFSNDDTRPPVKSYVWLQTPKTSCAVNEIANIKFGTSTQNTPVLYELMLGNTVLESRWIRFTNEIKGFEIPFEEKYGAGVTVLFTFMKDEQLFTKALQITRRIESKKLTPTLSVFRNKLQPGEKAEWTITVPESAKEMKPAELLVGMYDASLDAIRQHSWNFNPLYRQRQAYTPMWSANAFDVGSDNVYFNPKMFLATQYDFDELNWFGLELGYYRHVPSIRSSVKFAAPVIKEDRDVVGGVRGKDIADLKEVVTQVAEEKLYGDAENVVQKSDASKKIPVQIRTNFNETAFFYPQLRTDAQGSVKFTFTAPESLTRWNVKMLAHTKDLYFGQGAEQVVTQKDLMVQMNLPRFVRRSDKLVLSANVVNLTDKTLTTSVQFEMIDPATGKSIKLKDAVAKTITLAANETKAVEWELTEFLPYELVICKVVARAGNFSDGEQKYLPVLPDKVLVTESIPLTVRGNQTRTFNFESLIKNGSSVDTKSLTVEFSPNPTWYAVQALPTLAESDNEDAIDVFTAYYANSLAGYIANSNPKIAATFDRWKKAGGSREALLSNLEKNAELKNMLLDETPWVMAAKDETEQKRQIALLFDLNNQKNKNQLYWDKLKKLQLPSGGFTWYAGMPENRYITQEILLNLGRLIRLTGKSADSDQRAVINAALNYLDNQVAEDFENLKKYNKNYDKEMSVDNIQLFYLHLRSEYPEVPVAVTAQSAVKFYSAQSEKYWTNFTLYGKAMMAIVANRNGKTQLANDILKSLKENALKTDELGMYWANNTPGYFWNQRPIGIQAAIIEAFTEISKNTSEVDEMNLWLLKQKQTQCWDSPMATVDAIFALLNRGTDWLANDGSVEIKVGNTLLKPESTEAGTGYFKKSLPTYNISSETGKVTVKKKDAGIGWGAMYWQFYQDLDKVENQSGALKVTKKLFVEKVTSTGKTMLPIEQVKLVKGDKVITRLVVTTDRNLEFVALKDLRASCFEPVNQLSGCEWKEGVCYYQTTKDASTQFYFSYLPKGTYVFEYELWTNSSGEYTSGITTIQCQYAPEFISHTGGERIVIN